MKSWFFNPTKSSSSSPSSSRSSLCYSNSTSGPAAKNLKAQKVTMNAVFLLEWTISSEKLNREAGENQQVVGARVVVGFTRPNKVRAVKMEWSSWLFVQLMAESLLSPPRCGEWRRRWFNRNHNRKHDHSIRSRQRRDRVKNLIWFKWENSDQQVEVITHLD